MNYTLRTYNRYKIYEVRYMRDLIDYDNNESLNVIRCFTCQVNGFAGQWVGKDY